MMVWFDLLGRVGDLADGTAVNRPGGAVQVVAELLHELRDAACPMEMLHVVIA